MLAEERIEVGRRVGERRGLNERISLTRHPQIACWAADWWNYSTADSKVLEQNGHLEIDVPPLDQIIFKVINHAQCHADVLVRSWDAPNSPMCLPTKSPSTTALPSAKIVFLVSPVASKAT